MLQSSYTFLYFSEISNERITLFESQLLICTLGSTHFTSWTTFYILLFFHWVVLINSVSLVPFPKAVYIKIFHVQESSWYWSINFQYLMRWNGYGKCYMENDGFHTCLYHWLWNTFQVICLYFKVSSSGLYRWASKYLWASWMCSENSVLCVINTLFRTWELLFSSESEPWKLLTQLGV